MYRYDMPLSNVEISVAHVASSVTEIAPKSPLPITLPIRDCAIIIRRGGGIT